MSWRELLWPEVGVWLLLLALVAVTFGATYAPLDGLNGEANVAVAVVEAILVSGVFMQLLNAATLIRITAAIGVLWLALLVVLTLSDVWTRGPNGFQ